MTNLFKLRCAGFGKAFEVEANPSDSIRELKTKVYTQMHIAKWQRTFAADDMFLLRVYPSNDPSSGLHETFNFTPLIQAVAHSGRAAEKMMCGGFVYQFEGGNECARVMHSENKCIDYNLNRDYEDQNVDIVATIPPELIRSERGRCPPPTIKLIDGIIPIYRYLKRPSIIAEIYRLFETSNFVLMQTCKGTGKSTILDMILQKKSKYTCFYVECRSDISHSLLTRLKDDSMSFYYIDLMNSTASLPEDKDILILIDDAQFTYENPSEWELFINESHKFLPKNVKFLIAASEYLTMEENEIPAALFHIPRLDPQLLTLSKEESLNYMHCCSGLISNRMFPSVNNLIVEQCNGIIQALETTVFYINIFFPTWEGRLTEHHLLEYILSDKYLNTFSSLFNRNTFEPYFDEVFEVFIQKVITGNTKNLKNLDDDGVKLFDKLKKCGILMDTDGVIEFTSILARRCFTLWVFPDGIPSISEL